MKNFASFFDFAGHTYTGEKEKPKIRTTKIEWTESTWNPITGCSKISA